MWIEVRADWIATFRHKDARNDFVRKDDYVIAKADITFLPRKGENVLVAYQGKNYQGEVKNVEHNLEKDLVAVRVGFLMEL